MKEPVISLISIELKSVTRPQRPIVEIATRLRLLEKSPRIKDSVLSLEPEVITGLPSEFRTRPVAYEPSTITISGPDQESWDGIYAVVEILSPLKNPIG
jgi:hypothetical protein